MSEPQRTPEQILDGASVGVLIAARSPTAVFAYWNAPTLEDKAELLDKLALIEQEILRAKFDQEA